MVEGGIFTILDNCLQKISSYSENKGIKVIALVNDKSKFNYPNIEYIEFAKSKKSLSELAAKMQKYPQVLVNVKDVKKEKLAASNKINDFISEQEKALGNTGRILVRASGTESLIRVMVEAQEMQTAQKIADSLAELVRSELK